MPETLTIDNLLGWNNGRMPEPKQPNNLQGALALYAQNEKCIASFSRSHRKISRQLSRQFSDTVVASAARQANRLSRKLIGYGHNPNALINDLYNHQTIVDHLFFNFGQVLRECNAYMKSLESYYDFLCDKCKRPADVLETERDPSDVQQEQQPDQHSGQMNLDLDGNHSEYQRGIPARLAEKRKSFQKKVNDLDDSTARNCSGLIILCADQDMNAVEQTYENVHHLLEYCQGVTINLDELRTHLRMHLPVYLNAAHLAQSVKGMDKALKQMGTLTSQVFESYTAGYDFAERLYHQMPAVTTLAGMEIGFGMKNQASSAALRGSSERIQDELDKRGYS